MYMFMLISHTVLQQHGIQGAMQRPAFANSVMSIVIDKCPDVSQTPPRVVQDVISAIIWCQILNKKYLDK